MFSFLVNKLIYNKVYSKIECKQEVSCVATPFWMIKQIILKTISIYLRDTTLLCISLWTSVKDSLLLVLESQRLQREIVWKHVRLSKHVFLRLTTLLEASLKATCPTIKPPVHWRRNPCQVHTCIFSSYSHVHQNIGWLSVYLPSCGLVKNFTNTSFFIDTPPAHRNISNKTLQTSSCRYLKPGSFLQRIGCSPKLIWEKCWTPFLQM